jgi:hypothetical protein
MADAQIGIGRETKDEEEETATARKEGTSVHRSRYTHKTVYKESEEKGGKTSRRTTAARYG